MGSANFDYTSFVSSFAPPPGPLGSGQGQEPATMGHTHANVYEYGQGHGQGYGQAYGSGRPAHVHIRDSSPPGVQQFAQPLAAAAVQKPPQMEGYGGDGALRAALAAAPFDWSVFDDTTDGSGSTSPGSTRTW